MPVVFSSVVSTTAFGSTAVTTPPINASTGSDLCLVVGTATSAGSPVNPNSVTWDVPTPQNFTVIDSIGALNFFGASMWRLVGVTQATDTATINFPSGPDASGIYLALYSDVDQTTPIGDSDTASSSADPSAVSITLAGAVSGDMATDAYCVDHDFGAVTETAGANQTERVNVETGGSYPVAIVMSTQEGADGGVMSYTADRQAVQASVYVAALLKEAAGAGTSPISADLSVGITEQGAATGQGELVANLSLNNTLTAVIQGIAPILADVQLAIALQGQPSSGAAIQADVGINIAQQGGLQGQGVLTALLTADIAGTGNVQATGELTTNMSVTLDQAGTVQGIGALLADLSLEINAQGALIGAGSLLANLTAGIDLAGNLLNSGTLGATLGLDIAQQGALLGRSTLEAALLLGIQYAGTLSSTGALAAAILMQVDTQGTLRGTGALAAALSAALAADGNLSQVVGGAIQATATIAIAQAGQVQGTGRLIANVPITITAQGIVIDGTGNSFPRGTFDDFVVTVVEFKAELPQPINATLGPSIDGST